MNRLANIGLPIAAICLLALAVLLMVSTPDELEEHRRLHNVINGWLLDVGVPEDETIDCIIWAFGDRGFSSEPRELPGHWNERHIELFIMYGSDDLKESVIKVGRAYLEQKKE